MCGHATIHFGEDELPQEASLPNDKIVVLAAYLAGASQQLTDTEDIAIKANEIAPGRFSWRKYTDQINIEAVRKRLYDAAKPAKGGLISGGEREGWLLTAAGLAFCEEHPEILAHGLKFAPRLSVKEKTWQHREGARMISEAAFAKWEAGKVNEITRQEAERFFGVDDYIKGVARQKRIDRAQQIFRGQQRLEKAIAEIAEIVGVDE
ncbi:hypothetical protein GRI44_11260 [Altererythrobacter confluentis]|uniref:Uncharacterized protein n=1 Tax=Allopontixanthobacter confluentis TaxID=1849021 RepID=A0A6L7GIH8_9SPHN|nr:hypothetical protein [Allopontixanthobacter confluentis]MXP15326.1 hypothetical protein [Allopontixanthobacter confluentis]